MRVLRPGSPVVVSSESTVDFAAVRRQALAVVAGQAAVAVCGALICYAALDARYALSALIGGGIGAAATLVQVGFGLRNTAGKDPRAVVRGFYRGSAMKLLVTVALFVLARRGGAMAFGVTTGVMTPALWARETGKRRPHRVLADIREILACGAIPAHAPELPLRPQQP
jgi:F0F1-type ATP synthase assembly protein I